MIKKLISTISSGVLLGLSVYLHSIDHITYVQIPFHPLNPWCGVFKPHCILIPSPWYANLWPEMLIAGSTLLLLSWYREVYHGVKTLYKKWYNYEFGWQEESHFKQTE